MGREPDRTWVPPVWPVMVGAVMLVAYLVFRIAVAEWASGVG